MALILSAIVSGCTPSRPHYLREPGELRTYVDSQIQIEYPDVQTESLDEVTKTKSPITLSKPDFDKPWDLTLQEAVQTALRNSKVIRNLGSVTPFGFADGLSGRTAGATTVYDPAIFETDPYPDHKRQLGTGGNSMKYKKYENMEYGDLVIEISKKIELIEKKLASQSKSFDQVFDLTKEKQKMIKSIPSIQPVSNRDLTRIASGFGLRMHPIYKILKMHKGMDFTAPIGTEIYATGDGVVERVGWVGGYGKTIMINHGFGYKTRYAHCSKYKCRKGQKVKRGDLIGFVGNTGQSTGPHLHYEVFKNKKQINPVNFFFNDLSPEEYDKVIEISSRPNQSL